MPDPHIIRQLDEAAQRVDRYRRVWHAAAPYQSAQAYERFRAAEEYYVRLLDRLLGLADTDRDQGYQADEKTTAQGTQKL
jgi:hypothetical protein